jgi:uncharacterized membrane protein
MAFCPNCGAQATGSFCPNCGSPVAGTTGTGSSYTGGTSSAVNASGLSMNVASALCYLFGFITGIIFLVVAPYNQNKTVRFHAFQSIFLNVGIFVISIVLSMLAVLTHGIGLLLFPLYYLFVFFIWIYMMVTAYQGKTVRLPVVGDLAAKQA